ncbi:MAG: beta-ketoacyl synthase N-terminal-like domain-containing protein [Luteolibacter sp.]|jgi:3-oxoacyl-[acyl-carrier-protein] synthase II
MSVLGTDMAAHRMAMDEGRGEFRPLADLLGKDSPHAGLRAGWIEDRAALCNRMWSPASMAATHVAREAVADAGWSGDDVRGSALVLGTSRGNAAGWLAPWPGRRPFRTMAVSNTIHNEPASAVSIRLGIQGPSHVLASGCSAGLDALGVAMMLLATGKAERALVVAVDLPLVPALLDSYAASGLLSKRDRIDPYHAATDGFVPGEAAAAIAIEMTDGPGPRLVCHFGNCDAAHPLAIPANGGRTPDLLKLATDGHGAPAVVIPHATGTVAQARAEAAMFGRMFSSWKPDVCLLKPWIGHTLGASGLIETAILAGFLRENRLPPAFPGLTPMPGMRFADAQAGRFQGTICKLAHSLGGHNSLLYLQQP